MSISQVEFEPESRTSDSALTDAPPRSPPGNHSRSLSDILASVSAAIAPVWPLHDFVAVNPYMGLSNRTFLKARQQLSTVCDSDTLMPLSYNQQRYSAQTFDRQHIDELFKKSPPKTLPVT